MDDTRDRVIALEIEVKHLTDSVEAMSEKVAEMHDLLQAARGARWALIVVWIAVGGALASVPKILAFIGFRAG